MRHNKANLNDNVAPDKNELDTLYTWDPVH